MRTTLAFALTVTALALWGCRSDGGLGRRDSLRAMRWTLDVLDTQYESDVEATGNNVEALGDWAVREVTDPTYEMERTARLYLEGEAGP